MAELKVLISREEIAKRIVELGADIKADPTLQATLSAQADKAKTDAQKST